MLSEAMLDSHDKDLKIQQLETRLKDAESVIEFYANPNNYSYSQIIDDESDVNGSLEAGKKAREYMQKYKKE